jgi:hypothetical protein
MSSNSWRKYGGKGIVVNDTINVGTVVATQFLTRSTSSVTSTFDNVNILGEAIIHHNTYLKEDLFVSRNEFISNNLYLNNKLMFGIDFSNNLNPYAYVAGNRNNIGINTLTPSTIFHVTGSASEVLTVDTKSVVNRNIIAQNVNKKGIVVWAEDNYSNLYFYNDATTNANNTPNAYLRYKSGGYLSAATTTGIDLSAGYVSSHFKSGIMHLDENISVINTPGSLLMNSRDVFINSSNVFLFAYSPTGTPESAILFNNTGMVFNTQKDFYINSPGGYISSTFKQATSLGTVSISSDNTYLKSNVTIAKKDVSNFSIYNETLTVYDNNNNLYLNNVYYKNSAYTGNALTLVALDNSSNTQTRIVTPSGEGMSLIGGGFPNDRTRSMGAIQLTDNSGNLIPSSTILSGKDPKKYYSTFGLNTYFPKTEKYILDINGPTRIGNGEINTMISPSFEIKFMKFSKINKLSGIAVGSPTIVFSNTNSSQNQYVQNVYFTKDGGITWNKSAYGLESMNDNPDSFTSLYVCDDKFAIIGSTSSRLFYTYDGGLTWNTCLYPRYNDTQKYSRTTVSILIIKYTLTYHIFSVTTFTTHSSSDSSDVFGNTYILDCELTADYISTQSSNNNSISLQNNNSNYIGTLFTPNIKDSDANGDFSYFVGYNGIYHCKSTDTGQYEAHGSTATQYNSVFAYSGAHAIAVGNNIISWTINGSTLINNVFSTSWTDYRTSDNPSIGSVNLRSVYIYDLSNAVALGDNGVFIYSNNWTYGVWNKVPPELLNSSGIADRIIGSNLRSINMYDINTFMIANANQSYNKSLNQAGQGQIMVCYFPNIFNRANNKIFDVSGNMYISGDININDSGQLFSNNSRFNLLRNSDVKQIYIGNNAASTEVTGNLFVRNDISLNSRLFVYGDISFNSNLGTLGNITLLNSKTSVFANNFDVSLTLLGSSTMNLGTDASYINIGNKGTGGKTITIGTGGVGTSQINTITVGAPGDNITIYGNAVIKNVTETQFRIPLIKINTQQSGPTSTAASSLSSLTNTIPSAVGLSIKDLDDNFAGYMLVTTDRGGYFLKAPGSTNVVNLNVGSLVLPSGFPTQLNINNNIQNGLLVLSKDTGTLGAGITTANYSVTVKPIDISNVLLRNGNSTNTYQQIDTHVGVIGDISLNGRLLVQGDASLNNRLFLYRDASFCNRLFVNNDVSFSGNLFVAKSVAIDISGNESSYNLDVSGTSMFRGTIMPISLVDNSVLLSNTPELDFSNNFCVTWMFNVSAPSTKSWTKMAMSANGMFQTAVLNASNNSNSGGIYNSNDYGVNWTFNSSSLTTVNWNSIAISSDGKVQVASYGAYIYVSTDYGNNWVNKYTCSYTVYSVAVSADGKYISAITYGSNNTIVYVSSNSGNNFTNTTLINSLTLVLSYGSVLVNPCNIVMSSTGQYQVCTLFYITSSSQNTLWLSNNYGQTWNYKIISTVTPVNDYLNTVCISSSGKYICIGRGNYSGNLAYNLFVSSNYGDTFTATGPYDNNGYYWGGINMSANGQYIVAICPSPSQMLYSVNYGSTWTLANFAPSAAWQSICVSANGHYLTAGSTSYIYNSVTPLINMSISNKLIVYRDVSFNSRLFISGPVFQF